MAFIRRLRQALAVQTAEYAVAPGSALRVKRDGKEILLEEGHEVFLDDLIDARPGMSPGVVMDALIDALRVLQKGNEPR
jgi:hypothetical protein